MNCQETRSLLDAYADGELDAAGDREIESHLHACAACTQALEEHRALAAALDAGDLRFRAPAGLRGNILRSLTAEAGVDPQPGPVPLSVLPRPSDGASAVTASSESRVPRNTRRPTRWTAFAAAAMIFLCGVVAGSVGLVMYKRATGRPADFLAREIASGHVRSLLAGSHLTDVLSSDRHTVKPWFEGKLDFAPPVVDLSANGFPLVGGRLDYLAGRSVASLVYRRDKHMINVFVWPSDSPGNDRNVSRGDTQQGYHLLHWSAAGMNWWAVSDLNEGELTEFAGRLRSAAVN